MSIKGFPTQQKVTGGMQGQPAHADFATVQPTSDYRNALDVHARFAFRVGGDTPRVAGTNTGNFERGGTHIDDPSTPARVGDFVRFIDGDMVNQEIAIIQIDDDGDGFTLAARSQIPAAATDEFYIMRYITQLVDESGAQQVVVVPVVIGRIADKAFNDNSAVTITTATPVVMIASTAFAASEFEITNSSGVPMSIYLDGVETFYIGAGATQRQPLTIAVGTEISVRSLKGDVTDGFLTINLFRQ